MATDRLYFAEPYLNAFTAIVVSRRVRNGAIEVALDRSAFYPEGGGQPADHGALNGVPVTDVQSDDGGIVWHTISGDLPMDAVEGKIDWQRRFDHMQQHHGQHLLSAAFEELFDLKTTAFHLGADYATIDLDGDVTESQMLAAETRTNEIIWQDHPVNARFVTREELALIPLRKPPAVEGAVRVVSVDGFDHSACGGTHPRSTGAVGVLHTRRREKRGGETRVDFVCGGRALGNLRSSGALLHRLARSFTIGVEGLEDVVSKLREQSEGMRKRLEATMKTLLAHEAKELVGHAERVADTPVVHLVRNDLSLDDARTLAREVTAGGAIIVLGIGGDKPQVMIGRPASHDVDCGKLVREVVGAFGGKGGGQPGMAQGGVPDAAKLADAVDAAVERLRS
jgi:alanyl-tRNA synthetase